MMVCYVILQGSDEDSDDGENDIELPTLKEINYHGSVIIQRLLTFSDSKVISSSLLMLTPTELMVLACSPCGSHVIDAFLNTPTIKQKNKQQMCSLFKVRELL